LAEHLVHNERVKLQATALNNTAIALFISGVVQAVIHWSRLESDFNVSSVGVSLTLLVFAAFCHRWAFILLGKLREKEVEIGV
jgi:hypothetical protein